jgi:hypothetical protein
MKFKSLYKDNDNYYSVGINEESGKYIIEIVITWIAWYNIYFSLTAEEVEMFKKNESALRGLANEMAHDKGRSKFKDRLLLNQGPHKKDKEIE